MGGELTVVCVSVCMCVHVSVKKMKLVVFFDVTLCSLVDICQCQKSSNTLRFITPEKVTVMVMTGSTASHEEGVYIRVLKL